jgi:hypothetical protein
MPAATTQGEVGSSSRTNARWIQAALNKVMGLQLAVDGIIGPQTRSAIRAFQTRAGLVPDGIVGPLTERALIQAGAGQPSGSPPTPAAPPSWTPPSPPTASTPLRQSIVRTALAELNRWRNGQVKESDPAIRPVLTDYWVTGAGTNLSDASWWSKYPWSAAFISWVMRKAGAGSAFQYSASHAVYTLAAKQNRLANNSNPFKAYRVTEAQPQPGDLVCTSRAGSGATYDNIAPGMATHCDIVTEVKPGQLVTVGGNVSDSVKTTIVPTDQQGRVNKSGYFAVIKVG